MGFNKIQFGLVTILVLGLSFMVNDVWAQSKEDLHPCGTPNFKTDFHIEYEKGELNRFRKAEDTMLYLPITVHIVGTDAGSGYYNSLFVYQSLCQVNEDFEDSKIQFFVEGDFKYLDNSAYYVHSSVLEGADMMFENNVENTLNCYIVSDPAGNCGYNLPYAGIALSTNCMGYGEKTWSHEIGHALSVQHPFLGWEGNPYQAGTNAPEKLVYDYTYFRDTLIRDTTILDTTYTELVDRSNCEFAADRNCDTPNDFIARRWTCNEDGMSPNIMFDYNGVEFRSDGSLIMSYANDECQNRFSPDEVDQMRANIFSEKSTYLYNQSGPSIIQMEDFGLSPDNGETVEIDDVVLTWNSITNATEYLITIGLGPNMASRQYYTSKDTFVDVSDYNFFLNVPYHYEVIAVNNSFFCGPKQSANFISAEPTSTEELFDVFVGPTLISAGAKMNIRNHENKKLTYFMWTMQGQQINTGVLAPNSLQRFDAPLRSGIYIVQITDGNQNKWEKLIVH